MRVPLFSKLFAGCSLLLLLLTPTLAEVTTKEAAQFLPNRFGEFRAQGASQAVATRDKAALVEDRSVLSAASRLYISPDNEKIFVTLVKTNSDSAAFALLTKWRLQAVSDQRGGRVVKLNNIGGAVFSTLQAVAFYKGTTFALLDGDLGVEKGGVVPLANMIAETLDAGSGEIPVLIKHLPDWETAQTEAAYAVSYEQLQKIAGNRPVLEEVSFAGGTEAVSAIYKQAGHLVIVEYATPQLAADADTRINARVAQLRGEGKPVPSAYRRVGNYAVFVFDAPDEATAAALIDKVKYEKDVRWLGEDPFAVGRANRAWLNMSTSVIVNTVKATGIAILICLAIGGVFGGWIFTRRRAQAAFSEKFSDAGGMVRLNIDEISAQNNSARLIGHGDKVG